MVVARSLTSFSLYQYFSISLNQRLIEAAIATTFPIYFFVTVMTTLFHLNEHVLLLDRLRSFPHDGSNTVAFYCHIRTEVDTFVRTKMPDAPPDSIRTWYTVALYHLASYDPGIITYPFLSWDALSYVPTPRPPLCSSHSLSLSSECAN
jgi:hypothetical protein